MPSNRIKIASGGPYEDVVGYSRVVVAGKQAFVAGTTAGSDGSPIPETCGEQTRQTVEIMRNKLGEAGFALKDVVRVRMFVVDIKRDWQAVSEVMNEYFAAIKPR
ncbi:hypothetical protein GGI21_000667 [Coemansia aciculifera]|nr:hypothetical protein GGI21_000667 [Coemansia aciculifera]